MQLFDETLDEGLQGLSQLLACLWSATPVQIWIVCCHVSYLQNSQTASLNLDICEISHENIPK